MPVSEIGLPWAENNFAELLAAVLALEQAPEGWAGVLHSDNQNANHTVVRPAFLAHRPLLPPVFSSR